MPKQYTCKLCNKIFNQKCDYNKHINKKAPCITLNEMLEINKSIVENTDTKRILTNIFDKCLNALRDNEGLTGDKALRNMSYLLILKLIEPYMGNKIDIDEYDYDFSHIEDEFVSGHKSKLLEIVRFSKLSQEKEDNIPVIIKHLWDDILSSHPSTKNIFLKGKGFDIKHKSTYIKIIKILNTLPETEQDVLGDAYEEIIKNIMTGKVLGQFFTQPLIKKIMVNLINPQVYPDGKIDTCCDPTMGTGGFLIEYMKEVLKQARIKNIQLDWDFVKNEGIYGKEIETDTYQLAVSNMLISSGYMFEKLERGDSIREPILRKFDNILANPPFGIKGLKYDDFQSSHKNEYVPIKTDNAVSLFIQAIIYMLKINGKCAVVLPDGQDLFSKSNSTLIAIREYLVKTCDLKEIIYLPSGIFDNTSIKTCIFYFIKKREGTDVIEPISKISKTQRELRRDYKFSKTHQTTSVKFYDCNPYKDVKNLLVDVPIEKLAANSYSLNYAEYMKDEAAEAIEYEEGVVIKTLGEVCEIIKGIRRRSKDGNEKGLYPLYYCSILGNLYLDTFDYTNEGIIINKTNGSGKAMVYYGCNKYNVGETTLHFKSSNDNELKTKYVYYYLLNNINILQKYYKGANQKSIVEDDLFKIKIPIPPLERQMEIVEYLDFLYEKANKTSNEKIAELKQLNMYCLKNQKIFGENVVKTLGEVCGMSIKGNTNSKEISNTGEFPFYKASVKNPSGTHNTYCFDDNEYILFIKSGGNSSNPLSLSHGIGKVYYVNGKTSANTEVVKIKNNENIKLKYLYYYLKNEQLNIQKLANYSTNLGHIDMTKFKLFKIPIPPLERQMEIVEYCDFNEELIKQLEKEIDNNKKQARLCINSISKSLSSDNKEINEIIEEDE